MFKLLDKTYLEWDNLSMVSGIPGSFLKATEKTEKGLIYYKMSSANEVLGVFGHEAINEYLVSKLLSVLEILHTEYFLSNMLVRHWGRTFLATVSYSYDFKACNETAIPLDDFYNFNRKSNETPLDFCKRFGFQDYIDRMLLVDFLICNRDRHGANIEVLCKKNKVRLAPLFDHGSSFVAPYFYNLDAIYNFQPMQDLQVNNFIGSQSLEYNLCYIDKPVKVTGLTSRKLDYVFRGLDSVLVPVHRAKIREIIERRYEYAKNTKVLLEK